MILWQYGVVEVYGYTKCLSGYVPIDGYEDVIAMTLLLRHMGFTPAMIKRGIRAKYGIQISAREVHDILSNEWYYLRGENPCTRAIEVLEMISEESTP